MLTTISDFKLQIEKHVASSITQNLQSSVQWHQLKIEPTILGVVLLSKKKESSTAGQVDKIKSNYVLG